MIEFHINHKKLLANLEKRENRRKVAKGKMEPNGSLRLSLTANAISFVCVVRQISAVSSGQEGSRDLQKVHPSVTKGASPSAKHPSMLLLFVVVCCCWLLLVVVGCCWLLLVVVGCCWLVLVVVGCCWLLLVVVGCCWLLLVVVVQISRAIPNL